MKVRTRVWSLLRVRSVVMTVGSVCLLSLAVVQVSAAAPGEGSSPEIPDGVCYPVNGSGFIYRASGSGDLDKLPIGPFSAIFEGDSLVIEAGTVTVIDFRNRQRSDYGKDTRFKIPYVIDPNAPKQWEEIKRRLREVFRDRIDYETSASRAGVLKLWPDEGVEFAPDVPITLTWSVDTTATAIQIVSSNGRKKQDILASEVAKREVAWHPDVMPSGEVSWAILDADGEPILTGEFKVLTPAQADEKRKMYRAQATGSGSMPLDLEAAMRALADRAYLW